MVPRGWHAHALRHLRRRRAGGRVDDVRPGRAGVQGDAHEAEGEVTRRYAWRIERSQPNLGSGEHASFKREVMAVAAGRGDYHPGAPHGDQSGGALPRGTCRPTGRAGGRSGHAGHGRCGPVGPYSRLSGPLVLLVPLVPLALLLATPALAQRAAYDSARQSWTLRSG